MKRTIIDGNEAVSRAAMDAGCTFFAGYPITPATSIFQNMLNLLPPAGGICMQGEDEISSIGFCLGAAMAGAKAMTATSGPGISLYSEQISFAIGGEIPLVIVDVQRLGPSTGSATKGADGDIQFLRWGNSGGMPVVVLAPTDAEDCYRLTHIAFYLAEKYRCPVFIASNKEIGMTRESVDLANLVPPDQLRQEKEINHTGLPFKPLPGKLVPELIPIGGESLSRQTSSTHGEDGYITISSSAIESAIERMAMKLNSEVENFTFYELEGDETDTVLLITYGVTARSARQAVKELREQGMAVSLLILKTLYPVPETCIRKSLAGREKVLVVEMNCGQYVREIERLAEGLKVEFYGKMNGELIDPREIAVEVNKL
jgi:2-oxoglutarate ferredoxin oxidoreductase subunit alpha